VELVEAEEEAFQPWVQVAAVQASPQVVASRP
jgi:hypothetical protein